MTDMVFTEGQIGAMLAHEFRRGFELGEKNERLRLVAWLRSEAADLRRQASVTAPTDGRVRVWAHEGALIEAHALESCADKITNSPEEENRS